MLTFVSGDKKDGESAVDGKFFIYTGCYIEF